MGRGSGDEGRAGVKKPWSCGGCRIYRIVGFSVSLSVAPAPRWFDRIYHDRISAFHVKDAEFNPTGRQGVYSGYADWTNRAGWFRSLGDGQVDFKGIFSRLTQYGFDGWAVLEWECCLKNPEQGAAEGAPFIADHIIRRTEKAFDDFAGGDTDIPALRKMMGL